MDVVQLEYAVDFNFVQASGGEENICMRYTVTRAQDADVLAAEFTNEYWNSFFKVDNSIAIGNEMYNEYADCTLLEKGFRWV